MAGLRIQSNRSYVIFVWLHKMRIWWGFKISWRVTMISSLKTTRLFLQSTLIKMSNHKSQIWKVWQRSIVRSCVFCRGDIGIIVAIFEKHSTTVNCTGYFTNINRWNSFQKQRKNTCICKIESFCLCNFTQVLQFHVPRTSPFHVILTEKFCQLDFHS